MVSILLPFFHGLTSHLWTVLIIFKLRLSSVLFIWSYYQHSAVMGPVFHIKMVNFISVALISAETLISRIIKRGSFHPFSLGELINVFSRTSSCSYVEVLWPLLARKQHNTHAVAAASLQSSRLILGYKVSLHVWDKTGNWTNNNKMIIKVLQGRQQQHHPVRLRPPTPGTNLPFISRGREHSHEPYTHTHTHTHGRHSWQRATNTS